jgi:hypothetical protein
LKTPPQPSGGLPQFAPSAPHVVGVQSVPPHWFATPPPPHVCGSVQVPHGAGVSPPQPLLWTPHSPGYDAHVSGVHEGISQTPVKAPGVAK